MKVLQILPGLTLGGPTFSTTALASHIQALGHDVQFHTAEGDFSKFPDIDFHPYQIHRLPFNKQFVFSVGLYKSLKKEVKSAHIIQTNSLWQFPNFIHEYVRRGTGAKSVIVPRGTLSTYALSLSSWKKKLVLALGQRAALKKADMLIATCYEEYQDIRNFGLKSPVAIIPNGVEMPNLSTISVAKKKTLVFLSRIHQKKGVDILIDSWSILHEKFPEWNLCIAGPDKSEYANLLKEKCHNLQCQRVEFTGEITGNEKYQFLAEASLFALPTHSENFGIAVGEALACGTPVVTTTGAPWSGLIENDCGLWIDLSVENLTKALEDMMSRPMEDLVRMGQNGRRWIERDFSWDEIARKTIRSYEWLLNPDEVEKPEWIYID